MAVWSPSVVAQDDHPTEGGGSVTTQAPAGLLSPMHPAQPATADYPLPAFMLNFTFAEAATGASISIF